MRIEVCIPPDQYKGGSYEESTEVDVGEWLVGVGDTVKSGDQLVSVDIGKGVVDVLAPKDGVLKEILYSTGEIAYREDGEDFPALGVIETDPTVETDSIAETDSTASKPGFITPVARRTMENTGVSEKEMREHVPEGRITKSHVEEVGSVPAARAKAQEEEIDLATVEGSGPDGIVLLRDVERASANVEEETAPVTPETVPAKTEDDVMAVEIIVPSRRKLTIARAMQKTADMPPPAGPQTQYSMDLLFWFKDQYKDRFEKMYGPGYRLWYPLIIAFARVLGQARFADVNARWNAKDEVTERYVHVNLGISVDIDDGEDNSGPQIFVIPRAEQYHMGALAVKISQLLDRVSRNAATPSDMGGFTCIFNNIGALGHDGGVSIYPPGVSGVFNFGAVDPKTKMAQLAFFFDHRLFGGRFAGEFMDAVYKDMRERVIPEIWWRIMLGS